jgi:aspartate racemase
MPTHTLSNLASNDAAAQVIIYTRLTNRLAAAGAECVVVTTIGGHNPAMNCTGIGTLA